MSSIEVHVAGKDLKVSNLEKVLYPAAHFTKGQVIDYYQKIAPTLLPHMRDRALTLKRYPGGVTDQFFYEKHCPTHRPTWVKTQPIHSNKSGEPVNYCICNDLPTLVWVANLASLELHTSLAKIRNVDRPTMMAFDLDPGPPADILDCIRVAKSLRKFLADLNLESFAKTSGGKGLHIYVPLNTAVTFDQTKEFAHSIARQFEQEDPGHVLSMMSKSQREGKVFMDWSQNDRHKTTVSVYSLRARDNPTVSTPVTWEELDRALKKNDPSKLVFEADAVIKRVAKLGDLFEPMLKMKQKLPKLAALTN